MKSFNELLEQEKVTTEEALQLFDALDVVSIDEMIGRWKGSGFDTQHPMDGLLEMFSWYGKEFIDAENVHPLLFSSFNNKIFIVDPKRVPMELSMNWPILQNKVSRFFLLATRWIFTTSKSRARLRMLEHRGKSSATMIYDHLAICDTFRKVDENTLLGLMDYKGLEQPFFFVLRRDS